jgi:hypothetical protein
MCIVIDTNTFSSVFNENSQKFKEFEPVNHWILKGNGFLIYGGRTYKNELKKAYTISKSV